MGLWLTLQIDVGGMNEMARDRNRLCIEVSLATLFPVLPKLIDQDPFEVSYNVARTVTKDGLYTLRGEFMRASRVSLLFYYGVIKLTTRS